MELRAHDFKKNLIKLVIKLKLLYAIGNWVVAFNEYHMISLILIVDTTAYWNSFAAAFLVFDFLIITVLSYKKLYA